MKRQSKPKLKGTVLFTVISVMSLLIIFLTSTLVLAASASNRSHKNYSSSQTEYTARAAIDSFSEAMARNDAVAQMIINMNKTDVLTPSVEINDSALGQIGYYDNSGTWVPGQISIEYIDDTYAYNTKKNAWETQQILKVTATAELAGEESTVSAYIRKKSPDEPKPLSIKGLQTAGGLDTNNTACYYSGALTVGIKDSGNETYYIKNDTVAETDITFINGNLSINSGNDLGIKVIKPNTGTVIMGNLDAQNWIKIDTNYDIPNEFTQKNIPYLYVDGMVDFATSSGGLTVTDNNGKKSPYNIFLGSLTTGNQNILMNNTDLYLMDSGITSDIGKSAKTELTAWTESVLQGGDTQFNSKGGNIYSKGNVNLTNIDIDGNVRVEGDVTINGTVTVSDDDDNNGKSDMVVGGTLTVNSGASFTVDGTIYCDNVVGYGTPAGLRAGYVEVNNIPYPEEYVVDVPGYERVNNHYYEYELWETTEQSPLFDWHYVGKYGEDIGWNQKVYYDVNGDWKTAGDIALSKDDGAGNIIYYYYVECDKYDNEKEQVYFGMPTGKLAITNQEFYVVKSTDPYQMPVSPMAVGHYEPAYWTIADINGNEIIPTIVTSDEKSYYRVADGQLVSRIEALDISGILPLSAYGQKIYPETMTREAILGQSDDGAYKIVTTLGEMQQSIGYSSSGFDSDIYYNQVPGGTDTFDDKSLTGTNYLEITENTILSGNGSNINIDIKPGKNIIWVVLDNVNLSNDNTIFIDDSQGGIVNFFVNGNLWASKIKMVTTKFKESCTINDSSKVNINWYGSIGSNIILQNNSTMIGTAKMPYSKLEANVQGAYSVSYNDKSKTPVWIGSGLFDSANTNNNFQLINVDNVNNGVGSNITNELLGESWEIMYYDMY